MAFSTYNRIQRGLTIVNTFYKYLFAVDASLVLFYPFDSKNISNNTPNYASGQAVYDGSMCGNSQITTALNTYVTSIGDLSLNNTAGQTATDFIVAKNTFTTVPSTGLSISCWFSCSGQLNTSQTLFSLPFASTGNGINISVSGTNNILSAYYTNVTTNGLIAYFSFDGTIGSTSITETISSTTITGGTSTISSSAKYGTGCLDCTGTKFVTGTGLSITISTQFTICFWLKVNQIPNSGNFCYFALVVGTNNLYFNNYTNGSWGSSISFGSDNGGIGLSGLGNYPIFTPTDTTTWVHLSITINGTNWTQYRNGTQISTGTKAGLTALANTYTSITFGTYPGYDQYANCYLDDFRVYNRALSSAEIYTSYTERIQKLL